MFGRHVLLISSVFGGNTDMKTTAKLGTLGMGLLLTSSALGQSGVTSTKTAPESTFLNNIGAAAELRLDTRYKEADKFENKAHETGLLLNINGKATEKLTLKLEVDTKRVGAEEDFEVIAPTLYGTYAAVSGLADLYSLSIELRQVTKGDSIVSSTELDVQHTISKSVSTSAGALSFGGYQYSEAYFAGVLQYDGWEEVIPAQNHKLAVNAVLSNVGGVKQLSLYSEIAAYRSRNVTWTLDGEKEDREFVGSVASEWSTTPRNLISATWAFTDKLSISNTVMQYSDPETLANVQLRNYAEIDYIF